jgi:hypothetical protein
MAEELNEMNKKLDQIDDLMRKKPTNKPRTKIPLVNREQYADMPFDHQDDLDAYDSLMRKKVYYQNSYGDNMEKDFVQNGYKNTFGIFSKEFRERRYQISDLLKKQREWVRIFNKKAKRIRKFRKI